MRVDLDQRRRDEGAVRACLRGSAHLATAVRPRARIASMWRSMRRARLVVDHRADVGRRAAPGRRSRAPPSRPSASSSDAVGDVFLQAEHAQRRAALAGAVEGRGQHVGDDLLGERRGVDDHRVLAAGLGDQRHRRAVGAQAPASCVWIEPRDLGRAGEDDARDARIGDQRRADRLAARPAAAAAPPRGTPASCSSAHRLRRRSAASARPAWRAPRCRRRAPRRPGR